MIDINEGKRLLVLALNAGLRAAKLDGWNVYEEGHELHKMFAEEAKWSHQRWQDFVGSVVVAEANESEYGVLIVPVIKQYREETIAGTRTADRVSFDMYFPEYDSGDPSVGIGAYWIIDPMEMDAETVDAPSTAALDAIMWIVKESVSIRMDNAMEADYWQRDRELMEELELTEPKKIS